MINYNNKEQVTAYIGEISPDCFVLYARVARGKFECCPVLEVFF